MAMRRVVVTPTFAAGLGVVVAAVLAYPMQTVFNYAGPNGSPCKTLSCGIPAQAGGEPAAGDGDRMGRPARAPSTPAATGPGGSAQAPSRPGGTGPVPAAPPALRFRTSASGSWGFDATIFVTFPPGPAPRQWRLWFSYPSARVLKVWAAGSYRVHGVHSAVVTSADWPAQAFSHRTITVSIGVTGRPALPGRCLFDGRACHIGRAAVSE
jgi:hypothetical protein